MVDGVNVECVVVFVDLLFVGVNYVIEYGRVLVVVVG